MRDLDQPPGPRPKSKPGNCSPLTNRPSINHHGYWLRNLETAVAEPAVKVESGIKNKLQKDEIDTLVDRLFSDAATRLDEKAKPPPNRHPQGGLTFEFDGGTNRYFPVRKPAKELTKEEYTEICHRLHQEGLSRQDESMQKLYDKYVPDMKVQIDDIKVTKCLAK